MYNPIDMIGEKKISNSCGEMTIVAFRSAIDIDVQFTDGTIVCHREYKAFKKGKIKNPNHPVIHGIGYTGEGIYDGSRRGKSNKAYTTWKSMLQRCYDPKVHKTHFKYWGVTVCEQWHNYQNFAKWFYANYIEGFQLDKDILVKGNTVYSPDTCCFVPSEINMLVVKSDKIRGSFPIGVVYLKHCDRFKASVSKNNKPIVIGYFKTIKEAFKAYKIIKEAYVKEIADKWKPFIKPEVYQALYDYQVEITD